MRLRVQTAFLLGFLGGCFVNAEAPCPEGSDGCPCLDLECEPGLICRNSICAAGRATETNASASSTSPTTFPSGGEDSTSSTTAPATSTTAPSDDSTGGDETSSTTSTGTTGGPRCGDGNLDPDEQCDGSEACNPDCTLMNHPCNPLNNAGCAPGTKCTRETPNLDGVICLPFAEEPPGELLEGNCFNFDIQDHWCAPGLACATSQSTGACDINCCVEFCDRRDPTFMCTDPGSECLPALSDSAMPGLEHLGVCVCNGFCT